MRLFYWDIMTFPRLLSLLCLLTGFAAVLGRKSYVGYEVLEIVPETEHHVTVLRGLRRYISGLDFWVEPTRDFTPAHLLVSPENKIRTKSVLNFNAIPFTVIKDSIQSTIDAERQRLSSKPDTRAYDYTDFNRYEDFVTELEQMALRCNQAGFYCITESRGLSWEGRQIQALRIVTDEANEYFYLDSLTHAREWLSGATLMNIVNNMINDIDGDNRDYMRKYNWIVVPVVNPDGYEYTWDEDRYWRKSRQPNDGSDCVGTDINRNFDSSWSAMGSSADPCDFDFHGDFATDNGETMAIERYIDFYQPRAGLSFHTYGYYWLEPYATGVRPDHSADLTLVTDATCRAIELTYGDTWSCGNFRDELYEASGTTGDYLMDVGGVRWAWTPELRGDDFVIDASQIPYSVNEIWIGMKAKMTAIEELGY